MRACQRVHASHQMPTRTWTWPEWDLTDLVMAWYENWDASHSTLYPFVSSGNKNRKGGFYGWKPSSSSSFLIQVVRAQSSQFELFEFALLLKFDKHLPVEQFEASRAIRGSSISVSSTLPPSWRSAHREVTTWAAASRREIRMALASAADACANARSASLSPEGEALYKRQLHTATW